MNNLRLITAFKTFNEMFYEFISNSSLNLIRDNKLIITKDFLQKKVETKNAIFWVNVNYKLHYDKKHTLMFLKIDEWALIKLHHDYNIFANLNIIKKLTQQFVEFFKKLRKIENFAYKLNISIDWKIHSVFSVAKFQSFFSLNANFYDKFRLNNSFSMFVEKKSTTSNHTKSKEY